MMEKTAREIRLENALKRIVKWHGELPETGQHWEGDHKRPMSYTTCFGSNGARDYFRAVARDALLSTGKKGE